MAQHIDVSLDRLKFGQTKRRDRWWVPSLITFIILTSFLVYATWAAFQNAHYWMPGTNYLSPFYSPEIFGTSPHAFWPVPTWLPSWLPWSPALLILPFPAGFRLTCYYYRGAYYKAFWADPPACAVGEPRKTYWGERSFPLILQNIHRYFLYAALIFLVFLSWDAIKSYMFPGPDGKNHFGVGVGSLILTLNVILLSGYTLGCHSLRHLVGGSKDKLSGSKVSKACYDCSSFLNRKHMYWAWCSLFGVAGADVYVRLLSMGVISDWRII
jgi:hypothetical protein